MTLTFNGAAGFLVACIIRAPSQAFALPRRPLSSSSSLQIITLSLTTGGAHLP